ncbi:MAG TPA: ABC transporter ATP-binding protein [Beijerinckiaceae bacterium]|nr:ABC transporter ATP-binding protein [Beijerinckiaceae bacterium]
MLTLERLSKTYVGGNVALKDVSLTLKPGEIVAMVGGSGCGKTTLLRLVAGLDAPTQGSVAVDEAIITAPNEAIGLIFQEPRLLPWLTVADNIAFGLSGLAKDEQKARVDFALHRVGLDGYNDRWPRQLSGGQAQRVAISRALAPEPKVLLLDEPFSALDAFTRASLHEHLLALWEAKRPTLLIVTHDVEEAVALADRVIVMQPHPGRIFAEIAIDSDRPRDPLSDEFLALKRRILKALDGSLAEARAATAKTDQPAAAAWW